MASIVPVQRQISTQATAKPATPQFRERGKFNQDVYISDIRIQMDARFSAYGALEVRVNDILVFRQAQKGAFSQNRNISLNTTNITLREGNYVEVYIWNSVNTDPVQAGISYSYGMEPLTPASIGESRPRLELNEELSESVGGLDPETRGLLEELEKLKANIGAHRITIDAAELTRRITAATTAIRDPDPNLDSIKAHMARIFDLVGDQAVANDLTEIRAQLQGLLEAINNNEIELNTKPLEELLDDIKDKTVPDDLGIVEAIEIAETVPVPDAANEPLKAIRDVVRDLLNGFNLQELERSITVLKEQIPLFEAGGPDLTIVNKFKQLRLRLEALSETVPDPRKADSSALFPDAIYEPGTHVNVIDTRGYTHFIASMAPFVIDGTGLERIEGSNVAAFINDNTEEIETSSILDFKNSHLKKRLCVQAQLFGLAGVGGRTYVDRQAVFSFTVEVSTDREFTNPRRITAKDSKNTIYTMRWDNRGSNTNLTRGGNTAQRIEATKTGSWLGRPNTPRPTARYWYATAPAVEFPEFTERYARIKQTAALGQASHRDPYTNSQFDLHTGIATLAENRAATPGTAALSFEFQDSFGRWYPAIPAHEIGTIIAGGPPLVVRFSEARYGFPLPASASIFRARLDISGGNIGIGVGLLLLS